MRLSSTFFRYIGAMAGLLCLALALQVLLAPVTVARADGLEDVLGAVVGTGVNVLSGGIVGGLLRMAPEVARIFTVKADHAHELAMAQLSLEAAKFNATAKQTELKLTSESDYAKSSLDTLKAAITAQATTSGFKLLDAINSAVRPLITYWWLGLYTFVKIGIFTGLTATGKTASEAAIAIWTPFDIATFGAIINFWFLDRVLKYKPL